MARKARGIAAVCLLLAVGGNETAAAELGETPLTQLAAKILPLLTHVSEREASREAQAFLHAEAILAASRAMAPRWQRFAEEGGWTDFRVAHDLPALLAAVAQQESQFRVLVRRNNGQLQTTPAPKTEKADYGPMQVRAPNPIAYRCGLVNREDLEKMVKDLMFSYEVGACVLTEHLALYVPLYQKESYQRFKGKKRDVRTRQFLGLDGPRQEVPFARLARQLVVIERYNWGQTPLYAHSIHGPYARHVLAKFEYFRSPPGPPPK